MLQQRDRTALCTGLHGESSAFDKPGADHPVHDGQDFCDHLGFCSKEVTQLIGYTQYPLASRSIGENVRSGVPVDQVGGTICHASGAA